jgi:hypothetical protein
MKKGPLSKNNGNRNGYRFVALLTALALILSVSAPSFADDSDRSQDTYLENIGGGGRTKANLGGF